MSYQKYTILLSAKMFYCFSFNTSLCCNYPKCLVSNLFLLVILRIRLGFDFRSKYKARFSIEIFSLFQFSTGMKWLIIEVVFAVILSVAHTAPAPVPFADEEWRLPKDVVPLSYDLSLTTNVDTGARNFVGFVKIEVEIKNTTDTIKLNSRNLVIDKVNFDGADLPNTEWVRSDVDESLTIIDRTLATNTKHVIEITYSGLLGTGTTGFYRSSYRSNSTFR